MALVICVSVSEDLKTSTLMERITAYCDGVVPNDGQLLIFPRPGKLMALLAILNENRIVYHFQNFDRNEAS